jgi:hypothetical protein
MIGVFPLLGEGSGIGSRIREKYLDRPLFSPRPFPTTFKRSILRRIDGLELIYRAAAPSSMSDVLSLTRYLDRKYFLNVNNLINITISLNPPGCRTRSLEGSWGLLFPTSTSPEPEISGQEVHPYGRQKNAPGLIIGRFKVGRLNEREETSGPGRKSPVVFQTAVFQRGFASFRDERGGTAGQGNVYLKGANQGTFAGSDGRSQMIPTFDLLHKKRAKDAYSIISGTETRPGFGGINRSGTDGSAGRRSAIVTMPPIDLLHKDRPRDESFRDERLPDTSSVISGTVTRPGFGGINRSGTTGSVGRMMIFVPEALATVRGISPKSCGIFGISSAVGADLEMMARTTPIVRGDPSAMRSLPLSRGGDSEGVRPQISKPGSGNLPSLDFVEDLGRNVAGRKLAASDPRMTRRSYPELEQIEPVETKIIREVDLLREKKSGPDLDKRFIDLNLDRISDQVYSMIERRIRTERERRGLYG